MDIHNFLKSQGINIERFELIEQALTHSSYANEHGLKDDNERLEFMGDAVLQLWSSAQIYPLNLSEGQMTRLRAQLVCEPALANYSRQLGLNQYIRLGKGEERSGGREKDAIIADAMEAFLGALFLDQGMMAVDVILRQVITPHLKQAKEIVQAVQLDYKTRLQEVIQADSRRSLVYNLVSETGPSNAPTFVMNAVVDGLVLGTGSGNSKKAAEQAAAKNAFEKLAK
ncbi:MULTISPECIES: ribonuclease III [Terrabacteria group]|uniref:ribonuclease III n=1 Tax=Bacillati TaxID=1783272 RepID=UPI00193A5567|nr:MULTISPECIES: ribonuclease III [Terrabacteria group]MBW9211795.1 ribonuclease III [Trueperella sp. zg.1013]QRG87400.1 ribonuclease III [Bulleidia sp. zg-1006]